MVQNILLTDVEITEVNSDIHYMDRHKYFSLKIPENIYKISVEINYRSSSKSQIPIALFDPAGKLRAMKVSEHVEGDIIQKLWVAVDKAGKGGRPGPINEGNWKLVLYKKYLLESVNCKLSVNIEQGSSLVSASGSNERKEIVLDPREKWYCGELHMHSTESTGRTTVQKVIETAAKENLDFIAITDHFTTAHWDEIERLPPGKKPLVIHSCELPGERGHANLHGIKSWISPFVDGNEDFYKFLNQPQYSMNKVADQVHYEDGLFCINHPLSAKVGWRYNHFDMNKADLIEVLGLPDGPNSFLYPVLWDRFLCSGQSLVGVGSSDSHNPDSDGPWKLGVLRTWVYANSLSEKCILEGLKSGRVCITSGDVRMDLFVLNKNEKINQFERHEMGSKFLMKENSEVYFVVSLKNHKKGNLYIISDGLIFDVLKVQGSEIVQDDWEEVYFQVDANYIKPGSRSYFRAEFHEEIVAPYYEDMAYRDHTSTRGLTNPIWIMRS